MKKIISMMLMFTAMALFVGCGSDDDGGSNGGGGGGGAYVGEWVFVTSYDENDFYVEVIKLNSNGTGTQTLYHLCEYEAVYEVGNFTYSVSDSQITIKTPKETFTGNYSMGTYDGSRFLAVTIKGKTTTYMEMTSEIRNEINAYHPVPGDVH
mgnify:CR=1 FL=1